MKHDSSVIANSRACNSSNPVVRKAMNACGKNAASVFEYGVGDMVELSSGRKGKVLAKYEKDGDIKIDVDIAGTRMTFGTKDIARVVGNAYGAVKNAAEPPFCNNDDVFLAVERGDKPINDFIKYEVRGKDAEMQRGELPMVRKDLLKERIDKLLIDARRRVANLEEGLAKLRSVK